MPSPISPTQKQPNIHQKSPPLPQSVHKDRKVHSKEVNKDLSHHNAAGSGLDNFDRDTLVDNTTDHGSSLIQSVLDATRATATICGISLPIMQAATKTSRLGSFETTVSHHPIDELLCFSVQKAQREGRAKDVSGVLVNPLLANLLGSQLQFIRILSQQVTAATSAGASPLSFLRIPKTAPCLDTPVPTATPVAPHPSSLSLPNLPIMATVKQLPGQTRKGSQATLPSSSVTPIEVKPTSTGTPQSHTPAPFKTDEFQILKQGEAPRFIGDASQRCMSLETKSVRDILIQRRFDVDGVPLLQELDSNFGIKRRYKNERNLYQTRRNIVQEFIQLVEEGHLVEEDYVKWLQQQLGQQSINDLATMINKNKKRKGALRSSRNEIDSKPNDSEPRLNDPDYAESRDNDDDGESDKSYAPSLSAQIESSSSTVNMQPVAVNIESKWAIDEVLARKKRINSTTSILPLRFILPKPFSSTSNVTSTNESATESGVATICATTKKHSSPGVISAPYKKHR